MMGRQDRDQGQLFYEFSLDEVIPAEHLLRRINVFATAVLADLHDQLKAFYSDIGRPSVDPELMIRMLLVGYCCGKSAVAFADQALTPGQTSGKRLPILKPPGESPFSTASTRFGFTLRRTPSFIIVQYRFAPRGKFKVRRMSAPVKPNPSIRVPGSSYGSAKATRKRRGSARRGASMKSQQVWPTRNDGVSSETPS